jgi:acyl-CoA thioesterase FadM
VKQLSTRSDTVRMGDTDASGLLYFGAVYRWSEAVFSGWFADIGHGMGASVRQGIVWPVVHSEAEYRGPLTADDSIDLVLYADHIGRSSFGLVCDVRYAADHSSRLTIQTRHVYGRMRVPADVHCGFDSESLPDWLRSALT